VCIPHHVVLHKVNPTTAAVCCTKSYVVLANVENSSNSQHAHSVLLNHVHFQSTTEAGNLLKQVLFCSKYVFPEWLFKSCHDSTTSVFPATGHRSQLCG